MEHNKKGKCIVFIGRAGSGKSVKMENFFNDLFTGEKGLYIQYEAMNSGSKFDPNLINGELVEVRDTSDILMAALKPYDGDVMDLTEPAVVLMDRPYVKGAYNVVLINNVDQFHGSRIAITISTLCAVGITVIAAGVDAGPNCNINEATHKVVSLATKVFTTCDEVPAIKGVQFVPASEPSEAAVGA